MEEHASVQQRRLGRLDHMSSAIVYGVAGLARSIRRPPTGRSSRRWTPGSTTSTWLESAVRAMYEGMAGAIGITEHAH
jgi:hypothetical protein